MSTYVKDIQFDLIVPGIKAKSHNDVLLSIAQNAADFLNISEKTMHDRIVVKEDIGNSAIGNGVAIPHFKLRRIHKPFTLLATLDNAIKHEPQDGAPVDIYCLLISPLNDGPFHLRRLSRLSRLLKNETLHKRIHETNDREVIKSLLMNPDGWLMAA